MSIKFYVQTHCTVAKIVISAINFTELLQFYWFRNRAIVFFDFCLSALPSLWKDSISWRSTYTSISPKTDITYSSNVSSKTESGIPFRITLLRRPYCAKALLSDSYFVQRLSSFSYFCRGFSFVFRRFLITISFRFKISFFREFILLYILLSISFICESWFILTTNSCFFPRVL